VEDGSGAHRAGLEGDVEGAIFEAVVAEVEASFAEGNDLGVGCGVGVAENSVLAAADDFVLVDDDCAYGDFAVGFGGVGFGYGGSEVGEVVFHRATRVPVGRGSGGCPGPRPGRRRGCRLLRGRGSNWR